MVVPGIRWSLVGVVGKSGSAIAVQLIAIMKIVRSVRGKRWSRGFWQRRNWLESFCRRGRRSDPTACQSKYRVRARWTHDPIVSPIRSLRPWHHGAVRIV